MANINFRTTDREVVHPEASGSGTSSQVLRVDCVDYDGGEIEESERVPLLSDASPTRPSEEGNGLGKGKGRKKPFYRARPLWLVPFALVASITRGMTLAPRVEVFTQLSCQRIYEIRHPEIITTSHLFTSTSTPSYAHRTSLLHLTPQIPDHAPSLDVIPTVPPTSSLDGDDLNDSSQRTGILSRKCVSDPRVQAGAARLQMIMSTTVGLLSALTTGWWGDFGERHGRTRVLAGSTFGLLLTDLAFILASTQNSGLATKYGHMVILVAPVIEGALGGWSTLQATTSAYVSDCTSSGSRAYIFSRFSGVIYLGTFIGPMISGYLIGRSSFSRGTNVTDVFWVSVACSFVNFVLAVFVFPESLDKVREKGKGKARAEEGEREGANVEAGAEVEGGESVGLAARLVGPLKVFSPVMVRDHDGLRMRGDWNLTVLGAAYFGLMLSGGLYQFKYLYAEHMYGWGGEQLSWYISYLSGLRSIVLLVLLPYCIEFFKSRLAETSKGKKKKVSSTAAFVGQDENGKKSKPTRSQLGREMSFDLTLTRCSILMDMIANLFVVASPAPTFHHSSIGTRSKAGFGHSEALFVFATGMAGFGTGAGPAIHSLTLCILQGRENTEMGSVGGLFGAFAFLQSIGSMILGPMMFGMVYSSTVADVPRAIFMVASGMLGVSLLLMFLVHNRVPMKKKKKRVERERGRSRVSKDLRGGAAGYGSV